MRDFTQHRLIPLDLPQTKGMCRFFGYEFDRELVRFWWEPGGDLTYDDGLIVSSASRWWPWVQYLAHPLVRENIWAFKLGSSEEQAVHHLLFDRDSRKFWVGHRDDVGEALNMLSPKPKGSMPLAVENDEELRALLEGQIKRLNEVAREAIVQDRAIVAEFKTWLATLDEA